MPGRSTVGKGIKNAVIVLVLPLRVCSVLFTGFSLNIKNAPEHVNQAMSQARTITAPFPEN